MDKQTETEREHEKMLRERQTPVSNEAQVMGWSGGISETDK